jgi:hypothetical protein
MQRSGALSVYIKEPGPRSGWIFRLIFEELLGLRISIFDDKEEFLKSDDPGFNYSSDPVSQIPHIVPSGLLEQKGVIEQRINICEYNSLPVFFQSEGGDLPFDPLSMAFFLVSRYEEYLPHKTDEHGRFLHQESLAFKEGFLEMALVNRLALLLGELLRARYPDLSFRPRQYAFIPTFDIDIAYAHLGKGFLRTLGATSKLLLKGNFKEIDRRFSTMRGKVKDPFDNFDMIIEECQQYQLDPVFFILAGDRNKQDNNLSLRNKRFARLVARLSDNFEIGVHPSYRSGDEPERISMEMSRIKRATGKNILSSRQHFVRMHFPKTYNHLLENGIQQDYSMGYAGASGFRASIAAPFNFYDLEREMETSLRIHPFAFMDSSLGDYLNLQPDQYASSVYPIIKEVKECGGLLIAIWHNYAMANEMKKHAAFKSIMKTAAIL